MKLNISGMLYNFVSYGVTRDTHRIDFDQVARLAREHKPKLIVAGASAYPREIPHGKFAEIAQEVGAKLFVDMAHYAGLVAAGLHDNPVPVADFVTTTTHKTLRGPRAGLCVCKAEYAKDLDRTRVPRHPGRAADARHRRQGDLLRRGAAAASSRHYAQAIIDNAKALAEALLPAAARLVSGGTDNHLMLVDVTPLGIGGKLAEAALDTLRHHGQQEHDSLRRAQADGPLGHSHRHAGADHPRHGPGGDAADRPTGCSRRSSRPTTPSCTRRFAAKCSTCASSFPCRPPGWPNVDSDEV